MPAERAKGRLAKRPITSVATAEMMAVAANTRSKLIPLAESMVGLITSM